VRGRDQITGVLDGGAHAVPALAHRGIGQTHGMEMVLIRDHAAVIDLDVDQIGVDAVNGCAEGLEKHNRVIAASVTEGNEQWSVMSEQWLEVLQAPRMNRRKDEPSRKSIVIRLRQQDCSPSTGLQSLA